MVFANYPNSVTILPVVQMGSDFIQWAENCHCLIQAMEYIRIQLITQTGIKIDTLVKRLSKVYKQAEDIIVVGKLQNIFEDKRNYSSEEIFLFHKIKEENCLRQNYYINLPV